MSVVNVKRVGLNQYNASAVVLCLLQFTLFFNLPITDKGTLSTGILLGLLSAIAATHFILFAIQKKCEFLTYGLLVISLSLSSYIYLGLLPQDTATLIELPITNLGLWVHISLVLMSIFTYQYIAHVNLFSIGLGYLKTSLKIAVVVILLGLIIHYLLPGEWLKLQLQLSILFIGIFILFCHFSLWRKGVATHRSISLAWLMLLLCLAFTDLEHIDWFQFEQPLLLTIVMLKSSWLTLTMIQHELKLWRSEQLDKIEILETALQASQQQNSMLAEQENATEELEYKVQERTLELEIALRELSEKNQELEEKNTLDALTGIRNRSYFDKKYQAELRRSRREQTELSVVMLDIDHFKNVNDQHGHLVGDECIKTVAAIIKQALKRPSDDVCRYGGEEFAMILPNTSLDGAVSLVEHIRQLIADANIEIDDSQVHITASAGIASSVIAPFHAEDALLALADKQLYQAKTSGRNKVLGSHLPATNKQE